MEIQNKGGNCIAITTKKAKFIIDDNLVDLGLAGVSSKADIVAFTTKSFAKNTKTGDAFVIDGPGEYEASEVSVIGIPARAHMDEEDAKSATIYRVAIGTTLIAVVGHVHPNLTDQELEKIGMVDILIVPIGGNGYTLDAKGAEKLIKSIDPKVVIPTHYAQKGVSYEVPQNTIEDFAKETGLTPEKLDKLKIKNDFFSDTLTVYELEVTS